MVDPWWPLLVMALIQVADAVMCLRPMAFIETCLQGVRFPNRWWWVLPPLKFATAAGLVVGIWQPPLALLTAAGLVAYFVIAAAMHIRAGYVGRDFWLNCLGMLSLSVALLVFLIV